MAPETETEAKKPDDVVTLTIDGVERTLPKKKGLTIIQACEQVGIDIPRFCYHERLTIPANCRMCLVEVEKAPKLMPACHTEVRDGMVVLTKSEKVVKAQEAVLEFLLVNHPVDCPICDQAGECPLQDQYFKFDRHASRIGDPSQKVKKGKRVHVGPRVTLDQERCVLCTRCVRFMDEVAREPQLGMFWRNDHSYIDAFPGKPLDSNYSMNVVEICPVGALTNADFRFKKRVWNLRSSASICDGCARGCNAWVDEDERHVYRYRARDNDAVNQAWLCDHGRLSYKYVNDDRVLAGRLGRGTPALLRGSFRVAEGVASTLEPVVGRTEALGILVSARVSTEDALMAAWFAAEVMKADRLFVGGREDGKKDAILMRDDRNPNRLGVELAAKAFGLSVHPFSALLEAVDAGKIKMVYAVGTDVPVAESMAAGVFSALEYLAVQAVNAGDVVAGADAVLPAASHAETDGTFVNFMGRIQRFYRAFEPRGEAAAHWDWIGEVARQMGHDVDMDTSEAVFAKHAPRSEVLGGVELDEVGSEGIALEGVGVAEDQTGGAGLRDQKGVSRWPR